MATVLRRTLFCLWQTHKHTNTKKRVLPHQGCPWCQAGPGQPDVPWLPLWYCWDWSDVPGVGHLWAGLALWWHSLKGPGEKQQKASEGEQKQSFHTEHQLRQQLLDFASNIFRQFTNRHSQGASTIQALSRSILTSPAPWSFSYTKSETEVDSGTVGQFTAEDSRLDLRLILKRLETWLGLKVWDSLMNLHENQWQYNKLHFTFLTAIGCQ